jgi:inner membrane protein
MDSLTHIALGGLVGEVLLGKRLGKSAIVLGAVAQSIPDFDFVASFWMDVPHDLLAHRGFTHSFLFVILVSPLLARVSKTSRRPDISFASWQLFFAAQMTIHLLLDSLNAYGTGWLEPFSHERYSFHALFVADPFYTVPLVAVFTGLLLLARTNRYRIKMAVIGLGLSSIYLIYALTNKYTIDREVGQALMKQHIPYTRYFTTPTPLNTWLWMVVAEQIDGYQIGYRSVFDRTDHISFQYFPRQDSLLDDIRSKPDAKLLVRFSQGYYTVTSQEDIVTFNDLRFGQQQGWVYPKGKFVFQYYLTSPDANHFVVQRGRFKGWDQEHLGMMLHRIRGD